MLLLISSVIYDTGCTTDKPRAYPINGYTEVHRDKRVLGIKYHTEVKEVKTYEQKKEDLRISEAEAKTEIKIKRSQRQENFAFWLGATLLAGAVVSIFMGILSKGYLFWGTMAATCAVLGSLAFGFAHWIPYLKWAPVPLVIAAVLWGMRCAKDWSIKDWWKQKRGS